MTYGMTEDQYSLLTELVIAPLKSAGAQVFIFGSRATDQHHPYSDVDLLFKTDKPLPSGLLSQIKEAIEDSRFPYTVDLVDHSELAGSYRATVEHQLRPL